MRQEEAIYVGRIVNKLAKELLGPVLNLGSSTFKFRNNIQPHINKYIFSPLEQSGIKVIHSDIKNLDGVDITGSLFDKNVHEKLKNVKPSIVMLCNLLEHLEPKQLESVPEIINKITPPGGVVIVTVPYSYPLHYDPIDSYFRPSPEELSDFFTGFERVSVEIVVSTTYYQDLCKKGCRLAARAFIRLFVPFYRPKVWLANAHRILWLFRNYKISCVVIKKPDTSN